MYKIPKESLNDPDTTESFRELYKIELKCEYLCDDFCIAYVDLLEYLGRVSEYNTYDCNIETTKERIYNIAEQVFVPFYERFYNKFFYIWRYIRCIYREFFDIRMLAVVFMGSYLFSLMFYGLFNLFFRYKKIVYELRGILFINYLIYIALFIIFCAKDFIIFTPKEK
ncbi:MAG: hypothetical protein LBC92_00335 [Rickettsiales bacterium]|jgi:hypothetical protein|nr:hypothetical protein [Rickettsiales bacterium]